MVSFGTIDIHPASMKAAGTTGAATLAEGDAVPDSSFGSSFSMLRPVRGGNAFEETIEHILQTIKLGIFAPSEKLPPERELAEQLGVSRATLRDALGELQSAGYLEVQRGRYGGTYVSTATVQRTPDDSPLDPAEVEDVLLFRAIIEPAAAVLAAKAWRRPCWRKRPHGRTRSSGRARRKRWSPS